MKNTNIADKGIIPLYINTLLYTFQMNELEGKRVVMSVTNDLVSDQRVNKIASSLIKMGADVLMIGRLLKNKSSLNDRPYKTVRFKLMFSKGPFFYAAYNFRLFWFLLFVKVDIILANDLDTLAASYFAAKIRRKILVYDSHEYFTEVPELKGRGFATKTWLAIERFILPKVKNAYTVCQSIADEYKKLYNIDMQIVRNVPLQKETEELKSIELPLTEVKAGRKIVLYQGALNVGRGLEQAVCAMKYIENVLLVIIGSGDVEQQLHDRVKNEGLENKVHFTGRISFDKLFHYTKQADLGLVLQANTGLSYYYVLPNRLFDFIQAEIPIIVSDLPEMAKIANEFQIGELLTGLESKLLADKINKLLSDESRYTEMRRNMHHAAKILNWEEEEKMVFQIYKNLV